MTTPPDLRVVASACRAALEPLTDRDWTVPAGDLEWSCRYTLGHMQNAVLFYAVNLATRSTARRSSGESNLELSLEDLIVSLEGRAFALAEVVGAAPDNALGFHGQGPADRSGFAAMGCDEMLVHTFDVLSGLGSSFEPPRDACDRTLARLFPWVRHDGDPWAALLWANGRAAWGERPRLSAEWGWHCKPLSQWDGKDPSGAWV